MSNKFNKGNQILKKPKVCKPVPPPPPTAPTVERCKVEPTQIEIPEFGTDFVDCAANASETGPETTVTITWEGSPEVEILAEILNDNEPHQVEVRVLDTLGVYAGNVIFNFGDFPECSKPLTVTIIENGGA